MEQGGATKGARVVDGGWMAAGDGEDDEGRRVWDGGESEERERRNDWRTGGTLTWQVRLTDINLRFGGDAGLTTATTATTTARERQAGAKEAMVDVVVDDDGAESRGRYVGGEKMVQKRWSQAQPQMEGVIGCVVGSCIVHRGWAGMRREALDKIIDG